MSYPANIDVVTEAHGITGPIAWCFLFPVGAILMRLLRGPSQFWTHVAVMTLGLALFISNIGMGIWVESFYDGVCVSSIFARFLTNPFSSPISIH